MKVLLVGEESAGIQTLRALAQGPHRIVAVMASPEKKSLSSATLWQVAQQMGQTTWPALLVKDPNFAKQVRAADVDILLNVHSLFVMHGAVVNAPRLGSFNLHPGPLPRYAGLNAVSWAIYRGEQTHGVTLHKMASGIDTGAIVYQSLFGIEETDSALTLYARCIREGVALILRLLDTVSRDETAIPLTAQDLSQREYFSKQAPENGRLVWTRTAKEVVNFVRACDYHPFPSPWGHPRAELKGREIALLKARRTGQACNAPPGIVRQSEDPNGKSVQVACADEWIWVDKLLVGGESFAASAILSPGARLANAA